MVCPAVTGPLVTACGIGTGAVLAAALPADGAVAGCVAGNVAVPVAPGGVCACVGAKVGGRVAADVFCWGASGFAGGCCDGGEVLGRGWLLTAGCGEDVSAAAVLCGGGGKTLDGFRCGLEASRYLAAAWAAC